MLQRLAEYADRGEGDPVPVGYNLEPVRYWFELDINGRLLGVITAEDIDGRRPKRFPVPTLVRSSGVKPKLLADNAVYVLGVARESDNNPDRVSAAHRLFVDLVRRCSTETSEPNVAAVGRFLETANADDLPLPDDFDPTQTIGFRVDGEPPTSLPSVQAWWARESAAGPVLQCLVCGRELPAMERIQLKLKGIPGDQTGGLALISANSNAFESYGLQASLIAPTCQQCSDGFMKGANSLIAGESTHLRIGDVVFIFWAREPVDFSFGTMLSRPEPDQVRALLRSVWDGRSAELDTTPFYAAALSASGSRAVVRDWIETTAGSAQRHLASFFETQDIVDEWGRPGRPRGVFQLAKSTVRTGGTDAPPAWLVKPLVRCALSGGPLPWVIYFRAVERCRIERDVNAARASLLKMVLQSHHKGVGESSMTELDPTSRDVPYLCGRLFAELEAAQRAALGEVGANIVDRFYGTASSAPATVFGRLVRGVQPHLAKLRRDRAGAFHAIDRRLQDIMSGIESFPATLTLEQQGSFALGYYHQRAADRKGAQEHRASHENDTEEG